MTDDELHQLAGPYALDALDVAERAAFEAHLPQCPSCTTSVAEFTLTAAELGEIAQMQPPAALKKRIMSDIAGTPQVSAGGDAGPAAASPGTSRVDELARRRRPSGRVLALAAAALFVIVGGIATFALPGGDDVADELIAAPDALTVVLEPTAEALADASIEVVWSSEQDRALVRTSGLPDPGEGMIYELWFMTDQGVAPAGLFAPDGGSTEVVLDVDDIAGIGWGVTIEPDTGSDQPTSDVLFAGVA